MIHRIKIQIEYANEVLSGNKTFEIRENDRAYQKGDFVQFIVVDGMFTEDTHPLYMQFYKITYVLPYFGLKENYVAFSIKKATDKEVKNIMEE